ncbi:hypothetical protein KEM10_08665 [Carboxylicivirga linearis]|uniref:DUF3899 domain-containing protein n=1 Tax=Carboxylicivirga linearis TaxID=1628157 RepID=A0ABS5JTW7_9BACT|nr:hypothetical protein [Carboxylicivirga linearis]
MKKKLETYSKHISYYSTSTSNYVLQFSIAGIVIVWYFVCQYSIKKEDYIILMKLAFLIFILTILSALIQYAYLTFILERFYHREADRLKKETGIDEKDKLEQIYVLDDHRFEKISWRYFYTKIILLIVGYSLILIYLTKLFLF